LISSILVKTLMDHRYFHGIRTMAAEVMAHSAKESLDWIGLFHLKKAFQELFCIPGSPMTRSNNFSDRSQYLIQCAIPKAIAQIKSVDGRAPMEVKRFLLDAMRYNDNRGNDYSDDHYLATLMSCLAQSLVIRKKSAADHAPELSMTDEAEQTDFERKALEELGRHQRLDEWIPTYQNIYTTTALDCALELQRHRVSPLKTSEFLQYTRISNADNVRIKAWNCLIHLGSLRKDSIIKYIIHDIQTDPSPYFRSALLRIVEFALGQMALGDDFKPEKVSDPSSVLDVDMGEEQSARENALSRRKLDGALRALKLDLTGNEALKSSLENALRSKTTSVRDVADLLEICTILYIPKSEMKIVCKMPKAWRIHHLGNGKLRFYQPGHYRWKLPKRLESLPALQAVAPTAQAVPPPPPPITLIPLNVPAQKPKLSISLGKKKTLDMNATTTPTSAPERKQSTVLPPKPPTPAPVPEAKRPTLIVPPQPKSASPATTPAARATPIPSPTQTPVPLPSAPIQAPPKRPTPTPAPTQAQPKRPTPAPPSGPPTPAPTSQPPPSRAPSRTPSERTTVTAQKQFLVSLKLPPSKLAKWPHEPTRTSKPSNTAPQKLKLNFGAAKRKAENIGDAGERDLKRQQSIVALNGKAETNGVHGFQAESRDASASTNTSARSTPAPPSGPTAPVSGKPRMILKFKFRDGRAPPWLKRNGK
jgi:transcription initiation factor TFIID subunit 2